MNLTSKRMLQALSACVGAVALTASAQTVWVSDNFEAEGAGNTNAVIGSKAGLYKSHIWGAGSQYSNMVWSASESDASTIQAFEGSYTASSRPITEPNAQAQVLKLETEGQTLTRYVKLEEDDGMSSDGTPLKTESFIPLEVGDTIYVDTLMKFTPSEDAPPSLGNDIKLALYVNGQANLVVRHNFFDLGVGDLTGEKDSVFSDITLDPDTWHRITVKLERDPWAEGYYTVFSLYLDGVPLSHEDGCNYVPGVQLPIHGGPLFFSIKYDEFSLSEVSFQGTGYVDDLVVTDTVNFGGSSGLLLTLAYDESKLSVLFDSTEVGSNQTVVAGSELTITATDFYRVAGVASEEASFSFTPSAGAIGDKTVTGTAAATAAAEVAITAALIDNAAASTGFGGHSVTASKLAAWAAKVGVSEQQVAANADDWIDNYLLNIDEATDADIRIDSIVIDAANEKAIITVVASSEAVDFTDLNGTLLIYTTDDLTSSWGVPAQYEIDSTSDEVTIEVPYAAGNFIKVRVQ